MKELAMSGLRGTLCLTALALAGCHTRPAASSVEVADAVDYSNAAICTALKPSDDITEESFDALQDVTASRWIGEWIEAWVEVCSDE